MFARPDHPVVVPACQAARREAERDRGYGGLLEQAGGYGERAKVIPAFQTRREIGLL